MPRQESRSEVIFRTDPAQRSELIHSDAGVEVGVGTKIDGKLLSDVASFEVLPTTILGDAEAKQPLVANAVDANGAKVVVTNLTVWSTDDAAVATVDDSGVVTLVATGTCTITGTFNTAALGDFTDTCEVTVN